MCECVNACCERVSVRVSVVPALCLLSRGENREGASRWERRGVKMWGNYGGVFLGGGLSNWQLHVDIYRGVKGRAVVVRWGMEILRNIRMEHIYGGGERAVRGCGDG